MTDARLSDDGTIILFNSSSACHSHYQFNMVFGSGYEKIGKGYMIKIPENAPMRLILMEVVIYHKSADAGDSGWIKLSLK